LSKYIEYSYSKTKTEKPRKKIMNSKHINGYDGKLTNKSVNDKKKEMDMCTIRT